MFWAKTFNEHGKRTSGAATAYYCTGAAKLEDKNDVQVHFKTNREEMSGVIIDVKALLKAFPKVRLLHVAT